MKCTKRTKTEFQYSKQNCDQICRNFAPLTIIWKFLVLFLKIYLVFGKMLTLPRQFFTLLGDFSMFEMAKYSKNNWAIWSHSFSVKKHGNISSKRRVENVTQRVASVLLAPRRRAPHFKRRRFARRHAVENLVPSAQTSRHDWEDGSVCTALARLCFCSNVLRVSYFLCPFVRSCEGRWCLTL